MKAPMIDTEQVTPVQENKMGKIAGWASIVNIISWLLMAIPGFLQSSWSAFEIVTIPLSALIALGAGSIGLLSKVKMYARGAGQCVIGIFLGVLNVLLISIGLMGISAMVNCC